MNIGNNDLDTYDYAKTCNTNVDNTENRHANNKHNHNNGVGPEDD